MEIVWYGHSCFRLNDRGKAAVVTDPFDHETVGYSPLKLKADVVTVSNKAPGHSFTSGVKGKPRLLQGPGEYEIGNVFITGVQTSLKRSSNGRRNVLFVFDYDGVNIAHLGDLDRALTQQEVEALGTVNVLLISVGGGASLNAAKAAEVISLLEPGIVIPMHYKTSDSNLPLASLEKFLKEMGLGKVEPEPSLKVTKTSVPNETRVVVLDYAMK